MKAFGFQGSVLSFILALVALGVHVMGYIDETMFLVLIGLFGFTGLAALRLFIEEKGIKTYVVVGAGILGIVGLLTGVATPEQVGYWFAALGIISGATLGHAVYKTQLRKL